MFVCACVCVPVCLYTVDENGMGTATTSECAHSYGCVSCVAVCCSLLQWVAVGCSGLQWVAVGCSGLSVCTAMGVSLVAPFLCVRLSACLLFILFLSLFAPWSFSLLLCMCTFPCVRHVFCRCLQLRLCRYLCLRVSRAPAYFCLYSCIFALSFPTSRHISSFLCISTQVKSSDLASVMAEVRWVSKGSSGYVCNCARAERKEREGREAEK